MRDGAWSTEAGVNGGFLAAVVLRAMMAALDEPVLAVFRSHTSANGFFEEDGELWSRDGVLLAQSRQVALLLGAAR
jgi:acyl-CoA thioesterase